MSVSVVFFEQTIYSLILPLTNATNLFQLLSPAVLNIYQ